MALSLNMNGWGPVVEDEENLDRCLALVRKYPFEPSLRGWRSSRVCDFTFAPLYRMNHVPNTISLGLEEELKFKTVDSRPVAKTRMAGRYNYRRNMNKATQVFQQKQQQEMEVKLGRQKRAAQKKQQAAQQARFQRINNRHRTFAEWSIEPAPEWTVLAEIPLNMLLKMSLDATKVSVSDIDWCGSLCEYNKGLDRISTKQSLPLEEKENKDFYWVSTQDDEILKKHILEAPTSKNLDENLYVAATDQILACLMAAPQAKYSWHINVTKIENKVILDKKDGSIVDLLTVNETAPEPPMNDDPILHNRPPALGIESVKVNQALRIKVLTDKNHSFKPPPFVEPNDAPAPITYRYRQFVLPPRVPNSDGPLKANLTIITRGEVHGRLPGCGTNPPVDEELVYVCGVSEVSPVRSTWSSLIESQKGALLANEIRNNTNKFQKWVACAMVAGCANMRLGYMTRQKLNNPDSHNLLAMQSHMTAEVGLQIGLRPEVAWGIVRSLVDIIFDKPDGRYVLLKDPVKPLMRLYKIPNDEEDTNDIS